ncbi:CHAT domain-containing protein [Sabulicella rubraurantiaca]|uniref:CHAT domain-containing protein n=1 Tax=Sabulicella rubraurantiaca TaxID=2811429 RepID=UPI001A968B18|nr:CHAT domain-containing protein [Sabulicella rubraurantiaca]
MPDLGHTTLQAQATEALWRTFGTAQDLHDGIRDHGGPDLAEEHNIHTGTRELAAAAVRSAMDLDPSGLSRLRDLLLAALRARRGSPELRAALEAMGVKVPPHLASPPEKVLHLRVLEVGNRFEIQAINEAREIREGESRRFAPEFITSLARLKEVLAVSSTTNRGTVFQAGNRRFDKAMLKELGDDVFEFLMPPEVNRFFLDNLEKALNANTSLQVMLDVERAPSLAHIPWELAFDPRRRGHLCLGNEASLCREVDAVLTLLQPKRELRILGLVAAGDITTPGAPDDALEVDRERDLIQTALRDVSPAVQQGWCLGGTLTELRRMMRARAPGDGWSVFHFIGHGGFDEEAGEGYLLLRGAGGTVPVTADRLADILLTPGGTPQLVVLNCCSGGTTAQGKPFSSVAATLVLRGIPAVIAMQFPVSEPAALSFSRNFYEAISEGMSVQRALTQTRQALSDDFPEWVTPALFTSGGDFALVEPPA